MILVSDKILIIDHNHLFHQYVVLLFFDYIELQQIHFSNFEKPGQEDYFEICRYLAHRRGLSVSDEELIRQARALGVRFVACEMAMDVMGLAREELIEVDEVAGVASFAQMARESGRTLFI